MPNPRNGIRHTHVLRPRPVIASDPFGLSSPSAPRSKECCDKAATGLSPVTVHPTRFGRSRRFDVGCELADWKSPTSYWLAKNATVATVVTLHTYRVGQIMIYLSDRPSRSSSFSPTCSFERLCRICIQRIHPRKLALDHADCMGLTRQNELFRGTILNRTCDTQKYIPGIYFVFFPTF